MATKTLLLTFTNVLFSIKSVSAYYCNNDRCKETEYCCGNNICCASYTVWQLWYFWFGIVLFLVMLFMCICLWKYRYRDRRLINAYRHMSNIKTDKQSQFNFVKSETASPTQSQGKVPPHSAESTSHIQ
ncbi:uncharacterized protein LOC117343192 [Pecten maximus]|uniref:uncharacterized protein LOC117343192 n=1 Tax=Pecten maximus TaxID=6579 RepID=UPI001458D584|nr:uncharacterized protein LOC117343192 [Pecten maximus]